MAQRWEDYEDASRDIVSKINAIKQELRIKDISHKQKIKGRSGEEWEMEIIAHDSENNKPVLIECKCWSKPIPRDIIVNLAYRMKDVGGDRAFIITPIGLQSGAKKLAGVEQIETILLTKDSTSSNFDLVLANRGKHHHGLEHVVKVTDKVKRVKIKSNEE